MAYFKIIQENQIVDAGSTFLRWSIKWQQLFDCDPEEAQFVQSNKAIVYHDEWLRGSPEVVDSVVEARIVVIEQNEYDEICELLGDDQIIDIPVEEYPIEVEPQQEEAPVEKQQTVTEMRETIKAQQEQISMLTDCILELSEIVYGGE